MTEQVKPARVASYVEGTELHSGSAPHNPTPASVRPSRSLKLRTLSRRVKKGIRNMFFTSAQAKPRLVNSISVQPGPGDTPTMLVQSEPKDIWTYSGQVNYEPDDERYNITLEAIILFDSGCKEVNLISARLANRLMGPGKIYKGSPGGAGVLFDGQKLQSLGMLDVRWWIHEFRPRYEEVTCHVVDTELFELVIGRSDMDRLGLYMRDKRNWIGGLVPLPHRVEGTLSTIPLLCTR